MPTRTPTLTPRTASGPARAATSAADRASWIPPAKTSLTSSAGMPRSSASPTDGDGLFPEDEARPRPDVAAALAALEHEPPRAVPEVLVEQARRGSVQVGRDALALEPGGLVGAAAGDQGERGLDLAHRGELLGSQLGRNEAEDADSPRAPGRAVAAASRNSVRTSCFAQQRQGEEGKPTVVRDRLGERRDIADAGHRPLEDRVTRAVIDGQGRALGERPSGRGACRARSVMLSFDGLDDPAGRHEFSGEPLGERGVLTGGSALAVSPADVAPDGALPRLASFLARPSSTAPALRSREERRRARSTPARGAITVGLAAVAAGDPLAPFRRHAAIPAPGARRRRGRRPPRRPPGTRRPRSGRSLRAPRPASSLSASTPCNRTKEDSGPHHPPDSCPERISASKPADCASLGLGARRHSAIANRPDSSHDPGRPGQFVGLGRPDRNADDRKGADGRGD